MDLNIHQKLQFIQYELRAPKDKYNSFGKYHYRSCEGILEGVKPLLAKYKCTLTISDEIVERGNRIYVEASATLEDAETLQSITVTAYAREADGKTGMDMAQLTGACSSYARKYALNGLFCIDDAKDPDTDEYTSISEKAEKNKKKKPDFGKPSEAGQTSNGEVLPFDLDAPIERTNDEKSELLGLKSLMKMDGITEEMVLSAYKGKYSAIENIEPEVIQRELINNWSGFVDYIKNGGKK